jgi:AcrR family transcriptional regulator
MERPDSPPAAGLTSFDRDDRARERLLRAAADVFDRKGYAAASVREIVERAGLTKPALYYHFGSKEGMLVAILEEGARRFEHAIARALAHDGTVRMRVGALLAEIQALFRENVPAVRVAHAQFFGPREALPPFDFGRFERVLTDAIRRLAAEGMENGELRRVPIEHVTVVINGIIEACTDQELMPIARRLGDGGIFCVLDLIFDGLVPIHTRKES